MKEIPILFNGEMVRAILAGRKTQTRRPLKSPAKAMQKATPNDVFRKNPDNDSWYKDRIYSMRSASGSWGDYTLERLIELYSPFGKPGDVLWVRETTGLKVRHDCAGGTGEFLVYKADNPDAMYYDYRPIHGPTGAYKKMKWTPSIHMKKHQSRLKLQVKRVWVERVQDISEDDAIAEGIDITGDYWDQSAYYAKNYLNPDNCYSNDAVQSFLSLYVSIYGHGMGPTEPTATNPWVWCCEFEVVK